MVLGPSVIYVLYFPMSLFLVERGKQTAEEEALIGMI